VKTYSIRDLVTIYSVTEQTALKWIHSGDLKAINCGTELGRKNLDGASLKKRWPILNFSGRHRQHHQLPDDVRKNFLPM
jgi:hypothetical protein